ncbi:hypothetical protein M0R88_18230 [Halorussus gelatinilyticus]|uniref:Uncharacterized protein n=1 Tax=Halorussus gelatinilyticus TaxID=2937524 RepID=A0A8U0IH79_9EURY|nr:hypothetical protein [Halorussus gelatinilyticus]UPW00427.1 hypothetical protein M0R88_18230 [Halorussus gelatinilyticus]
MQKSEFFDALTLWFVAAIFLRTGSGSSNPAIAVMAIVATLLSYAVPLYLLGESVLLLTE